MIDGFRFRLASAGLIYRDSPEVCAKASPQNYWPVRRAALIEFPRSKPSLMFPWNAKTFFFFFFFCHRSNEKGTFCILTSNVLTILWQFHWYFVGFTIIPLNFTQVKGRKTLSVNQTRFFVSKKQRLKCCLSFGKLFLNKKQIWSIISDRFNAIIEIGICIRQKFYTYS